MSETISVSEDNRYRRPYNLCPYKLFKENHNLLKRGEKQRSVANIIMPTEELVQFKVSTFNKNRILYFVLHFEFAVHLTVDEKVKILISYYEQHKDIRYTYSRKMKMK